MLCTLICLAFAQAPSVPDSNAVSGEGGGVGVQGRQLAAKVNQMRHSYGLPDLEYDTSLAYIALMQSRSQATCRAVSHYDCTDERSGSFFDRMHTYCPSATSAAENVGSCTRAGSWAEMFDLWNTSKPHHRSMVSPSYTSIGVAHWCNNPAKTNNAVCYWTAVFVSPTGSCTGPVVASGACSPPLSALFAVILLLLPLAYGNEP